MRASKTTLKALNVYHRLTSALVLPWRSASLAKINATAITSLTRPAAAGEDEDSLTDLIHYVYPNRLGLECAAAAGKPRARWTRRQSKKLLVDELFSFL